MSRLLLLVVLAYIVGFAASASDPDICEGGRACVSGQASCKGGACVCAAPSVWGAGTFACYDDYHIATEIKADPKLTNFNNETVNFPFPCRYLVSFVRMHLKNHHGDTIGHCKVQIHAYNAKHRGKFFVNGFDVAVKLTYDSGEVVKRSSRNYGIAEDGKYKFVMKGTKDEYLPHGPWKDDDITYTDNDNRVNLKLETDDTNNQIIYSLKKCGVFITFVPYDIVKLRAQPSLPGLAVRINRKRVKEWLGDNKGVGLSPHWDGGVRFKDVRYSGLDDEQTMIARSFTRGYVHNQPNDDKGMCSETEDVFKKCTSSTRKSAMKACMWILQEPRFLRCIDSTRAAKKTLKLFSSCIGMWCSDVKCSDVQKWIRDSRCQHVRDIPKLRKFMDGDMCPT